MRKIVLLSLVVIDGTSDNSRVLNSSHSTEESEAFVQKWWFGDVFHTTALGPFTIYQGSWTSLNTSKYLNYVAVCRRGNAREIWRFNKTTTPNTQVSEQHLGSRQKGLRQWEWPVQSPNRNPIENLRGDIINAVSEAKPKNPQELWNLVCSSQPEMPVSRCQKLVDTTQRRGAAVVKNNGYATIYSFSNSKLKNVFSLYSVWVWREMSTTCYFSEQIHILLQEAKKRNNADL